MTEQQRGYAIAIMLIALIVLSAWALWFEMVNR